MKKSKKTIESNDIIKTFIDMIAPSIIKFNTDHFICGNTYRCIWALREYPSFRSSDRPSVCRDRGIWHKGQDRQALH